MVFNWVNVGTPFSWSFVAALLLGLAAARAARRELGSERWALVYAYLTGAVALAAGAVFVPGPKRLLDLRVAYLSIGAAALGFLVFRYKLTVGLPVLLLAVLFVLFLGLGLRGFSPQRGASAEVARLHVFDASQQRIDLEVTPVEGPNAGVSVSGTLPDRRIVPRIEVIHFSPCYFFLSSPVLFRLVGVASSSEAKPADVVAVRGEVNPLTTAVGLLPGVAILHLGGAGAEGRSLQDYRVELSAGLTVKTFESQQ